ncbi:shikimate kinase [Natranaerovirga hydrolytica]|uniref:Shikimate kinase n=1 Tax=Natranaerovirga hydrolytica TaxID=680378 RepID=A0A4R1M4L1_9FIRM|nr:shikimate kinase [Natranaerovirga hydrolytica]TCK86755.1 shikimate kinase [Natranaerovirga hydrolytica]
MKNIILIGMPGVGKSTVGVLLAKTLGYEFIDTDLLIQKEKKTTLQKIINKEGIEGFLKTENEVVSQLKCHQAVIATGGSVVYGQEAMENMKALGTVVFLELPLKSLQKRLKNIKTRGVAMKEGQTLKSLFEERVPLYETYCDIKISAKNKGVEKVIEEIVKACL